MIHWQTVKEFFGFGGTVVEETAGHDYSPPPPPPRQIQPAPDLQVVQPVTVRQPQISLKKAHARKAKTNPKNYYRRGGRYYSVENDSLIEDLILIYVLSELFTEADVDQYNDGEFPEREVTEDLLDVDVSSTPVVEAVPEPYVAPEPAYTPPEPEPTRYDSGSSYSSGSSDSGSSYDSGSSDSGGDGD